MEESPNTWDLLTSSLAVWDLEMQGTRAWAFLVIQGLVHDNPGDRDRFLEIVRATLDAGPAMGSTVAQRAALGIREAGLAAQSRDLPDPMGKIAKSRLETIREFGFAVPWDLFRLGDVYIDFPYEEAMFRVEHRTKKIFRKFYGEREVEIPHDSELYHEALRAGTVTTPEHYARGRPE